MGCSHSAPERVVDPEIIRHRQNASLRTSTDRHDLTTLLSGRKNRAKLCLNVKHGLSAEMRKQAWLRMSCADEMKEGFPGLYELLLRQGPCADFDPIIAADVGRTFPSLPFFGTADQHGPGQAQLYRILTAYAHLDRFVGYCQGMCFVAGLVLLVGVSERDAFYIFSSFMLRFGVAGLYGPGLPLLHEACQCLNILVAKRNPSLFRHLQKHGMVASLYATKWFMSGFVLSPLPLSTAIMLMDLVLSEPAPSSLPLFVEAKYRCLGGIPVASRRSRAGSKQSSGAAVADGSSHSQHSTPVLTGRPLAFSGVEAMVSKSALMKRLEEEDARAVLGVATLPAVYFRAAMAILGGLAPVLVRTPAMEGIYKAMQAEEMVASERVSGNRRRSSLVLRASAMVVPDPAIGADVAVGADVGADGTPADGKPAVVPAVEADALVARMLAEVDDATDEAKLPSDAPVRQSEQPPVVHSAPSCGPRVANGVAAGRGNVQHARAGRAGEVTAAPTALAGRKGFERPGDGDGHHHRAGTSSSAVREGKAPGLRGQHTGNSGREVSHNPVVGTSGRLRKPSWRRGSSSSDSSVSDVEHAPRQARSGAGLANPNNPNKPDKPAVRGGSSKGEPGFRLEPLVGQGVGAATGVSTSGKTERAEDAAVGMSSASSRRPSMSQSASRRGSIMSIAAPHAAVEGSASSIAHLTHCLDALDQAEDFVPFAVDAAIRADSDVFGSPPGVGRSGKPSRPHSARRPSNVGSVPGSLSRMSSGESVTSARRLSAHGGTGSDTHGPGQAGNGRGPVFAPTLVTPATRGFRAFSTNVPPTPATFQFKPDVAIMVRRVPASSTSRPRAAHIPARHGGGSDDIANGGSNGDTGTVGDIGDVCGVVGPTPNAMGTVGSSTRAVMIVPAGASQKRVKKSKALWLCDGVIVPNWMLMKQFRRLLYTRSAAVTKADLEAAQSMMGVLSLATVQP